MAYRRYLLMLLCSMACFASKAQVTGFAEADSISYARYQDNNWKGLLSYGNQAIASGVDFPNLRLRMAYAQFILGNYSGALTHYHHILADNSHDHIARYYSYLCNLYLNRNAAAYYHLSYLDSATISQENLTSYGLIRAGLEATVKFPGTVRRGNGLNTHVSLANRLGWKLQLDQSVFYFKQKINYRIPVIGQAGAGIILRSNSVDQVEYYGKLNYSLDHNISVWGGYHYLRSAYAQAIYNVHIALAGIKYSHAYYDLQADIGLSNANFKQYNAQLSLYPLGNLNFYTTTRGSWLQQEGRDNAVLGQLVGIKVTGNTWFEAFGNWGKQDNYQEADGLYVYNAIDIVKFKAGATAYYQVGRHAQLYFNYTYEQKGDLYQYTNYNQHSMTGGLTWRF